MLKDCLATDLRVGCSEMRAKSKETCLQPIAVILAEEQDDVGQGVSSGNSEVYEKKRDQGWLQVLCAEEVELLFPFTSRKLRLKR